MPAPSGGPPWLDLMDPGAVDSPMGFDWSLRLLEIGPTEVLRDSQWTVTGPDAALVIHHHAIVTGLRKTQCKRTGGTLGGRYQLTNHIWTNSGVELDATVTILIEQAVVS